MLSQVGEDGGENPIAYASRKPKLKRACYPTIEMQDMNTDGLSRGGRDVTESSESQPWPAYSALRTTIEHNNLFN